MSFSDSFILVQFPFASFEQKEKTDRTLPRCHICLRKKKSLASLYTLLILPKGFISLPVIPVIITNKGQKTGTQTSIKVFKLVPGKW